MLGLFRGSGKCGLTTTCNGVAPRQTSYDDHIETELCPVAPHHACTAHTTAISQPSMVAHEQALLCSDWRAVFDAIRAQALACATSRAYVSCDWLCAGDCDDKWQGQATASATWLWRWSGCHGLFIHLSCAADG